MKPKGLLVRLHSQKFVYKMKRLILIIMLLGGALSEMKGEMGGDRGVDSLRKVVDLKEVTVYSSYKSNSKGNSFRYSPEQAALSVSVTGEPDMLMHLTSLPGVSQGMEGTLGLFVRGGNSGSNGLYFNGTPMYASSHLLGLFSVYPPELVNEAVFTKGGMTASKGNMTSSILDVTAKRTYGRDGWSGALTVSPYLSGFYTSVPVVNEKLAVQVSARSSFMPYVVDWFNRTDTKYALDVSDVAVLTDWKISRRQSLDFMYFKTNDYFGDSGLHSSRAKNWHQKSYKLGWEFDVSDRLKIDAMAYSVDFRAAEESMSYDILNGEKSFNSQLAIFSELRERMVKGEIKYLLSAKWNLAGGLEYQNQNFFPASQVKTRKYDNKKNGEEVPNHLFSMFLEGGYAEEGKMDFQLGCRYSQQSSRLAKHNNVDLHFAGHYYLTQWLGVEVTADRLNQYYHVLEGLPTGWSLNLMTPADGQFSPELTHQVYTGIYWNRSLGSLALNFSLGGYYKDMRNIVMYRDSKNAFGFSTNTWREEVEAGEGHSLGVEGSGSVQGSRWGCTVAYTLSKTDRRFPTINSGRVFPFKFDRPHIFNFQGKYTLARGMDEGVRTEHVLNSSVQFSSGHHYTLCVGKYEGVEMPYWGQVKDMVTHPDEFYDQIFDRQLMSPKNGLRMRNYFRVDAGYSYKRTGKKFASELTVSVFNLLNRRNPYQYYYEEGTWKQLSILPILPSIRWSFRW